MTHPRWIRMRRLPLIALLTANGISQLGNTLSFLAVPWFVLETTGSASRTGITVAVRALPVVLAGIFGGALVDRLGYKRMSVVSDLASALGIATIPLLYHTTGLSFWQLLVLVFVSAGLGVPGMTARRSIYPELAEAAAVTPDRANASYQVVFRSAGLVAPPLAGILIVAFGAGNLLWLDAASFLLSAAVVTLLVPSGLGKAGDTEATAARRYLADVVDGFRFIRRNRVILAMTVTFALGSLLAEPIYSTILPVYANRVYGSAVDLGLIFAALAAGSLAGNAVFLAVGSRLPRREVVIVGFTGRALILWVLVFLPPAWVIALAIGAGAVCLEPANPLSMTIMQERVPAGMRGRVFGAMAALGAGTLPLGMLAYGFLIEGVGLRPTLFVLAAVNLTLPAAMPLMPGIRDLSPPHVQPITRPHRRARPVQDT